MTVPLLVTSREAAIIVEPLQMRCESTEMPGPLQDDPVSRWIGVAQFGGDVKRYRPERRDDPTEAVTVEGSIALCVTKDDRLLIIVAPMTMEPAVWIAAPLRQLTIEPVGSQGLFRKRPRYVTLSTPRWNLDVGMISEVFGRHAKANQTGALHDRLTRIRVQTEN
jgi:hypothetical protein